MGKINSIQLIRFDDLQRYAKDIPSWVKGLIDPLNQFMETISGTLRKGVTLADNIAGSVVEVEFTSGVELEVNPQSRNKVIGVRVMYAGDKVVSGWGWRQIPNASNNLGVTINFADEGTALCRLFIDTE